MQKQELNRRQFLQRGAIVIGGTVVACSGLAAAGLYTKPVEFPSTVAAGTGSRKALVAYASKCGSTAEIAKNIAGVLVESGRQVDLLPAADVTDLSGYDLVVLGSAIRMSKWMPAASDFVSRFQQDLVNKSTAFFTACLTLRDDTPATRQEVTAYLQPVRDIFQPDYEAFFAGRLDYGRLSLVEGALMKYAIKAPEGDFRDWQKIRAWAEDLPL